MNSFPSDVIEFEVDLVFHSMTDRHYFQSINTLNKKFLTDSSLWKNYLHTWLRLLRLNESYFCPEIVTVATSLSLGLQFTDDSTIRELNKTWLNKPEATDVLSFPLIDESYPLSITDSVELGDIVVSIPTAQRQAQLHNHPLSVELQWLVSHGLLHLLGWDHQNSEALQDMLACQEHLMVISGNVQSKQIKANQ